MHVRRGLPAYRIGLNANRIAGTGHQLIANICYECQRLPAALAFHIHQHRRKRRVIDADAHLLGGRDENVIIAILAQDGGEQSCTSSLRPTGVPW